MSNSTQQQPVRGHDVQLKDIDGTLSISIDGHRFAHVVGYQIARQPGSPQPVLMLTIAVKKLNDQNLVQLATPIARGV